MAASVKNTARSGGVREGSEMLGFLRKVFGAIALASLALLFLCWVTLLLSLNLNSYLYPNFRVVGVLLHFMFYDTYVGAPASIIWAVLKVISVLSAPRVEQPAPVVAPSPRGPVPTSSVLGITSPPALPQARRSPPASSPLPAGPDVYTYSAPGMPTCPMCGQRPIIFYCSTHQSAVCLDCVAKHDEPGKCVYVPAYRAPKDAAEPQSGGKPGSILGIG